MGITISQKAIDRAAKRAKNKIEQQDSFIKRNLTMLKISIVVALTIIYYAFSYWAEYANIQRTLYVAPSQVNWSQHRRLSLLLIMYDLRKLLTQTFFKTFEAGGPGIVDVSTDDFFRDLNLLNDIENGLAFGSDRFVTDAPTDATPNDALQNKLLFVNACPAVLDPVYCGYFSHRIMTYGMHAGLLEYSNKARAAFVSVNSTINSQYARDAYDGIPTGTAVGSLGTTPTANGKSQKDNVLGYLDYMYSVFHNEPNTWIQNTSETFLAEALGESGKYYVNAVQDSIDSIQPARIGTLVAFIVLCFGMYVFYYSPMCWALDAEQKRTSAMLLMIPADVMERIPSIREFVTRLDVKNV